MSSGYSDTLVLRGVDLAVPEGAVVALLGPNGAGKTTLLRTASGLLPPSAGTITLDGVDVSRARPYELARRGLCHIPEGRGVFPTLTVRDNLVLAAPRRREREAIEHALAVFPALKPRLKLHAGSLSGGEQQMLALVRAYLHEPRIVLVDEPSLGLAPLLVDQVFEFLAELRRAGTALLLVEQYVNRALQIADHVVLLNRGEVVFSGTSEEMAKHDVLASYLGAEMIAEKGSP